MPPRHTYWTIVFGDQPTAFRSAEREELLPTFKQILTKHPDAVMRWFARGRLWRSPEEARDTFDQQRESRVPQRDRSPDPRAPRSEWRDKPQGDRPRGPKPEWKDRPQGDRPKPAWQNRDDRPRTPRPGVGDTPPRDTPPPTERGAPSDDKAPDKRGRDWRPGGAHKDPRDRFKVPRDVKRARFKQNQQRERANPRPPRKKGDDE